MPKKALPRVTEPAEGLVHYAGCAIQDTVTLCGLADFNGTKHKKGEPTTAPVTCQLCLGLVEHVRRHRD